MFRKPAVIIAGFLLVVGVVAQFKSVPLTNPPVQGDLSAPPEIDAILRHACYDCHSNETRWPWYSHIAPISWAIAHHVDLARQEINFSEWDEYFPRTRERKLEWMQRALHKEVMPPWSYRLMHPGARLSNDDRARLKQWIDTELARSASAPSAK
jgi:hypothetical protein